MTASEVRAMGTSGPRLMIVGSSGKCFVMIDKPRFTIGRRPDCDLHLAMDSVSKRHAAIVADGETYLILDTNSRFGTFVNDVRATNKPLSHGDHLDFGHAQHDAIIFFNRSNEAVEQSDSSTSSPGSTLRQVGALFRDLRAEIVIEEASGHPCTGHERHQWEKRHR